MEVNKVNPMRTETAYLFLICCSQGVSQHHLCLAGTQRQPTEEWERFTGKAGMAQGRPDCRPWSGEAGGGPAGGEGFCVIS